MKQIEGQMSMFDTAQKDCKNIAKTLQKHCIDKKPLIYSLSLTCHKTICPYCKFENPDSEMNHQRAYATNRRLQFWATPLSVCPSCGKEYDRDNKKVIMSKDYAECEALGLKGAVRKNDKGQWEEAR